MEKIPNLTETSLQDSFASIEKSNPSNTQGFLQVKMENSKKLDRKDLNHLNSQSCSSFFRKKLMKVSPPQEKLIGPGYYNILPQLQQNVKRGKGFTFSAKEKTFFTEETQSQKLSMPAPNQYEIGSIKTNRSPSFRFGNESKNNNLFNVDLSNSTSNFVNSQNLSDRKFVLATHKNTPKTILSTSQIRFDDQSKWLENKGTQVPGPGQYDNVIKLSDNRCPISKLKGTGRRLFDKQNRLLNFGDLKNTNPGPGAYNIKSSFIHPDFKKKPTHIE